MDASFVNILLTVWGAITLIYGALLMWRYLVGMREDNVVILDANEAGLAAEQAEVQAKLQRLQSWSRIFGFASLVLLLALAGIFGHRTWVQFNGG